MPSAGRGQTITAVSADGMVARAFDTGAGPAILVVHPGLDDGRSWSKVAARLSHRFRVVRIVRRHYRLDLPDPGRYSLSAEVGDVLAIASLIAEPIVIVGHSSGGVVALEAIVASPASFAGAVLFEPPVATGPPDPVGSASAALARAQAAVTAGQAGRAAQIFVRDVVGLPAAAAAALRPLVALSPRLRGLVPRQITDLDGVGVRIERYAAIDVPTVLLGAERSPAHLGQSLAALAAVMPRAEHVVLPGRDHMAHVKAPAEVARVIEDFSDQVLQSCPPPTVA